MPAPSQHLEEELASGRRVTCGAGRARGLRLGHACGLTGEKRPGDAGLLARLFAADVADRRWAVSALVPALVLSLIEDGR